MSDYHVTVFGGGSVGLCFATSFASTCPPVLLLQNGMGSEEIARRVLGPDTPVYFSAMMIGTERHGPASIVVTAKSSPTSTQLPDAIAPVLAAGSSDVTQ